MNLKPMTANITDFSVITPLLVKYAETKENALQSFDYGDFLLYLNDTGVDLTDSKNYLYREIDGVQTTVKGRQIYNHFSYNAIIYLQETLMIKTIDRRHLYCLFFHFFKNPEKYKTSNEIFEISMESIHKNLYIFKKHGSYKGEDLDTILEILNERHGIPQLTAQDNLQFLANLNSA